MAQYSIAPSLASFEPFCDAPSRSGEQQQALQLSNFQALNL